MGIEFRQRTVGEYVQILKRRKWLLILPALAFFTAVLWVVLNLPNYYESTTFLIIKPATISEKVAPSLTDEDLSQRLQSINQTVLSRSSLEPMVAKYNLFEAERAAGMPIEQIIDMMRRNIRVEPERSENEKIAGFRLTYRDSSPKVAQAMASALANKYVNVQISESTQSAETTREFIDNQMNQAQNALNELEQERLGIMMQNIETLPESSQGLIAQLNGLRQREETISKDKETLILERGRVNESIRAINNQMRLIEDFGEKETQEAIAQATQIEDTPAYGQLIQRRAELSAKLDNLKTQYREKHPDIVQTQIDIQKINEELEALATKTEQRAKKANQTSLRKVELQKKSLEIERQKVESQIGQIEFQMRQKDLELVRNAEQIAILETKINAIPNVKIALEAIDNKYYLARTNYDNIVKKYNDAQQQVERESNAQGESIRVVDEANLPHSPTNASKRPFFLIIGLGLGLGFGLFLVALFEVPKLFKIQSIEDTKYYTGLPVLAAVPPLLTEKEVSWQKRMHLVKVLSGVAIAVLSVPLLVVIFQLTRVFERS